MKVPLPLLLLLDMEVTELENELEKAELKTSSAVGDLL